MKNISHNPHTRMIMERYNISYINNNINKINNLMKNLPLGNIKSPKHISSPKL